MKLLQTFCLGAAAWLAAAQMAAAQNEPLKIGAILAISGPASVYGSPAEKGLKLIANQLTDRKLAGHPVTLTVYDTEGNSTKAVQLFRRLVDNDEVDVVLGPSTSGESLAIVPVANQLKIPNLTYGGAEPITSPVTPQVFALSPTDRLVVEMLLDTAKTRGTRKLGLLYSQDGFGQSGGNLVQKLASTFGVELVAVETFSPQDTNMTPQLLRIRDKSPDAIIVWSANPGPTITLKNAAELGIKTPFFLSYANASLSFLQQTGTAAEGAYVAALPIVAPDTLPDSDARKAPMVEFAKKYQAAYGAPPDQTSGHALDSFMWLEIALKSIKGPLTRSSLRDALESTKMCGADGCRELTPTDHRGLDKSSLVLMQARNGKWEAVKP